MSADRIAELEARLAEANGRLAEGAKRHEAAAQRWSELLAQQREECQNYISQLRYITDKRNRMEAWAGELLAMVVQLRLRALGDAPQ
jgi:uncharacterized coiled-coil protein SlyX